MSRGKLAAATVLAAALFAPGGAGAAGDAAHGKALATERDCGQCHGPQGISVMPDIPSLAGHPEEFITLQLILFREGIRDTPPMPALTQGLTDQQVEDLAAFYASLPPGHAERGPRDAARYAAGAALAERLRCGTCHLPQFQGRAQMPRLTGQREDYLVHALTEYRDGTRRGTDTNMNAVMYGVSDTEIAALAHFMAQQE
ncbi:c-type cytochrome [Siccirubricoccus sp. KC 17139]|uniref:C-type cytochrome n=1 Tax=Siccirubricoccus soli TaxID=2899147 RepID=A0ABT1D9N3_9PROT|nr:c-type cytochrome [Siccirubricoccus soli]MCP2684457.1 c-type cytochrome [Siccirubricoccus soli]